MSYGDEQAESRRLHSILKEGEGSMTEPRPAPEALRLIRELAAMKPEDDWGDKFYAAVGALWQVIKGSEFPAQGEPPHVVMARLIEDVSWSAPQPESSAVELLRELVGAVRSGNPGCPFTEREEEALHAARTYLAAFPPSDPPAPSYDWDYKRPNVNPRTVEFEAAAQPEVGADEPSR